MPTRYEEAAEYSGLRTHDWAPIVARYPLPIQPSWLQRDGMQMTDKIRRDAISDGTRNCSPLHVSCMNVPRMLFALHNLLKDPTTLSMTNPLAVARLWRTVSVALRLTLICL